MFFSFRMNTTAAVSAANLLVKSVKSAFPKQKKNLAIVQFKQALKRRTKSHEESRGMFSSYLSGNLLFNSAPTSSLPIGPKTLGFGSDHVKFVLVE